MTDPILIANMAEFANPQTLHHIVDPFCDPNGFRMPAGTTLNMIEALPRNVLTQSTQYASVAKMHLMSTVHPSVPAGFDVPGELPKL